MSESFAIAGLKDGYRAFLRMSVGGSESVSYTHLDVYKRQPFLPDEYFGRVFNPLDIGLENCQTMIIFPAVSGFVDVYKRQILHLLRNGMYAHMSWVMP